jgi:hypothetical protein
MNGGDVRLADPIGAAEQNRAMTRQLRLAIGCHNDAEQERDLRGVASLHRHGHRCSRGRQ